MSGSSPPTPLVLQGLEDRHPGLTPAIGQCYSEAAAVALQRHHQPPIAFRITTTTTNHSRAVMWEQPTAEVRRAWANSIDTTEAGAYGLSLAAVEVERGLVAIARAETGTGADYYIAPAGSDPDDLEDAVRLEVSGTDGGDESQIAYRLSAKIAQTEVGNSNLPAMASVVGFKHLRIAMSDIIVK